MNIIIKTKYKIEWKCFDLTQLISIPSKWGKVKIKYGFGYEFPNETWIIFFGPVTI